MAGWWTLPSGPPRHSGLYKFSDRLCTGSRDPQHRLVGPIVHGILDLVTPGPSTPARPVPRRSEPPQPELRAARKKVQRPCFEAAIRVVVSSPITGHRAKRHLRSRARAICAAFAEYAAENTLTARRLRHPDAVIASARLQGGDLYSAPEIAALAHLPLDRDVPGVSRAGASSVAPPPEILNRPGSDGGSVSR
jgi:hypothetical protein